MDYKYEIGDLLDISGEQTVPKKDAKQECFLVIGYKTYGERPFYCLMGTTTGEQYEHGQETVEKFFYRMA